MQKIMKSNLHYALGITPKRVTSGGIHLRSLAHLGMQRWRDVGDTVFDLITLGIEPQTSCIDIDVLNN